MILNGLSQHEDMEIYSHLDVQGCTDINAISIDGNYVRKSPRSFLFSEACSIAQVCGFSLAHRPCLI